jgi:hypothetical protein
MELGRELARTMAQINAQIEEVKKFAKSNDMTPFEIRDSNGNWIMAPLLAAKAQALHALVLVNQRGS